MLYTRASFLRYLTNAHNCEIITIHNSSDRVMTIKNGSASTYMFAGGRDVIDYEEIYLVCRRINVPIPGERDLKRAQ